MSYFVKIWFRLLPSPLKRLFQEFISLCRETMEWRTEGVSKRSKHCWSLSCGGREQQVNIALATVLAGVEISKDKDRVTVHGESDATSYVNCYTAVYCECVHTVSWIFLSWKSIISMQRGISVSTQTDRTRAPGEVRAGRLYPKHAAAATGVL